MINVINILKTKIRFKRILFYPIVALILIALSSVSYYEYRKTNAAKTSAQSQENAYEQLLQQYKNLNDQIADAIAKYPQIDLGSESALLLEFRACVLGSEFDRCTVLFDSLLEAINKKVADEGTKGILSGKITNAGVDATIKIFQEANQLAEFHNLPDGTFLYWLAPGQYVIKATAAGYSESNQNAEIKTGETAAISITLSKISSSVSSTVAASSSSSSVSDGIYSRETVATERGTFTVHLLRVDMNQYDMKIDTAADGDCQNDCPVKSLGSYVAQNGGFAGIHGTYFCPTAYSTCAGKTNSFYYKLFNTRLSKQINWTNGLGDYLPFISIDTSGSPRYFDTWASAKNTGMRAGISCRPHLVEGGEIVLVDSDMDSDKERYSKISHGFIGIKGQTIYAGIVLSANLPDSASVVKALGIENAFNIDGGGTSAMYYNGSYKVGPGRDMPNAIIFVRK